MDNGLPAANIPPGVYVGVPVSQLGDATSKDPGDLFEDPSTLAPQMQSLIERYCTLLEEGEECQYVLCEDFLAAVQRFGYTFDYGLDGVPINLRSANHPESPVG